MLVAMAQALRVAVGGLGTLLMASVVAAASPLITEQEAQLPLDQSDLRVGIERGPDVVQVYPGPNSGALRSPFNFRVRFEAHGGTRVDLDSVSVVYKRLPAIDLTERVRPFLRATGIDMPNAEVPAGVHRIWIFLKDSAGHDNKVEIRFEVTK
jgi:hypothetical protein